MIHKNTFRSLTVLKSSHVKLAVPRFEVKHKFWYCAISLTKENSQCHFVMNWFELLLNRI